MAVVARYQITKMAGITTAVRVRSLPPLWQLSVKFSENTGQPRLMVPSPGLQRLGIAHGKAARKECNVAGAIDKCLGTRGCANCLRT